MKAMHRIFLAVLLTSGLSLSGSGKAAEPWFSQAELDQMLAPIALYPDTVLSHVLIAATYPLEVIQAARWTRANPGLSGEAAVAAVDGMEWDPSVMALVAFPELLTRMDEDIEWTHRLGDAFLVQEPEVIDTIQQLRERAYAAGHLRTNEQVRVVRETRYIYIEPARPRVVFVPYYDPFVVYGSWWWSSHPPVIWRHRPRHVASVNFYWGPAYHVAPAFYFSSFHWSRRQVVVVHHHHHHHHNRHFRSGREVARYSDARHWQHNPQHRRGVSYHRGVSEQRFVQSQASQTRSAPARSPQARNTQRDWAAGRRDSLDLRERQAPRSSDTRRTQAQVAERASSRSDTGQRQRAATQGDRVRSEALIQRDATAGRSSEPAARQRRPERNADRLQNNLAANRPVATRQERAATTSAVNPGRTQPNVPRERSTAPRPNDQPTRSVTRERASAPAASREAPAQSRAASNRTEPGPSARQAPTRRPQPAAGPTHRAAPAQRNGPGAPSRPDISSQSRPQPAAASAPRNAPARSAPAQRPQSSAPSRPAVSPQSRPQPAAAPAPRSAPAPRAAPPQQRSGPAQRENGASRTRSRERQQ